MTRRYACAALALLVGCSTAPRDGTVTVSARQTVVTAPATVTFDVRNSAAQTAELLECPPHLRATIERFESDTWVASTPYLCGDAPAFPVHLGPGKRVSDDIPFTVPGLYRFSVGYGMGPETVLFIVYSQTITVQ